MCPGFECGAVLVGMFKDDEVVAKWRLILLSCLPGRNEGIKRFSNPLRQYLPVRMAMWANAVQEFSASSAKLVERAKKRKGVPQYIQPHGLLCRGLRTLPHKLLAFFQE